ncbi:MAG: GTPase HflX [Pseudomonadota bacterium]
MHPARKGDDTDSANAALAEGLSLTRAIDLNLVGGEVVWLARPHPATLFGPGKVEEIAARLPVEDVGLVIVNTALSPVQQRNLETAWHAKVIDRTGLILEIFGARAQTREGVLQVELAHLTYQKSRLVRSWTHLERQRGGSGGGGRGGGGGFLGGPGERQLESDRRQLDERIQSIKRQLDKVVKTRTLHRAARKKVPYPIVALVGYTNAGKSTLFNRLTEAGVMAEDMLFATLDPTMRQIDLPSGRTCILSDTVGFISDLPTQLVAAFRATLEEVLEADLVVHVRDIANPDSEAQNTDVHAVLRDLGLTEDDLGGLVEVLNKTDLLTPADLEVAMNRAARSPGTLALSAVTGAGTDELLEMIEARLFPERKSLCLNLGHAEGRAVAWLYERGVVTGRDDGDDGVALTLNITAREFAQFRKLFPNAAPDQSDRLSAG